MKFLQSVEQDFWWDVARKCEYATFFHTPLWQELALRSFTHYRDATIGAVLPNGVRVVLPLLQIRQAGPWRECMSTHELYYGGPIADGPLSISDIQQLYGAACGWRTLRLWLTSNPLAKECDPPQRYSPADDFTHIVPLDAGFEEVFARFSKASRNAYRGGLRKGLRVRQATTPEDCRAYYDIYAHSLQRWQEKGVSIVGRPYTWQQFESCFEVAQTHPAMIRLWLAEVDQQIVAGNWVFYWNQHSVCWHGSAHSDFFTYRPFNVLDIEIVRDAIARGYTYYDLGPSGGVAGVIAYKDGYGIDRWPIRHMLYTRPELMLARKVRDFARPNAAPAISGVGQ